MTSNIRWLIGLLGTWIILSGMSEVGALSDLAAALAISVAVGATFIIGPKAFDELSKVGIG